MRPVAELAEREGKSILWPRLRDGAMDFARVRLADLVPGAFGIFEPPPHAPPCAVDDCDLVVVPGRGFDHQGSRLGRGKGHYDRALKEAGAVFRLGVAFERQLVERLPVEPHDQRMDAVITEVSVLRGSRRS